MASGRELLLSAGIVGVERLRAHVERLHRKLAAEGLRGIDHTGLFSTRQGTL